MAGLWLRRVGVTLFIAGLLALNSLPALTQSFPGLWPTDKLMGRDSAGTGQIEAIGVTEGIAFTGSGSIQFDVTSGSTESNIESAIDTLANLTSVQGFTLTYSDPNADAFFGWDDSAGAWEALTAAEAIAVIETADGSGSGLDADTLDGHDTSYFQTALTDYVATVADGTGIDGTASGAGSTYTPTLDLTEISSTTWGAGSFTTMTFDAGAVDPVLTFGSDLVTLSVSGFRVSGASASQDGVRQAQIDLATTDASSTWGSIQAAYSNNTNASGIRFEKSRNGSIGSHTVVQADDEIGLITGSGSDGSAFIPGATISMHVDGTPGANDMPGRIEFATTADGASSATNRWIIDNAGALKPATNDGAALGNTTLRVSDLFLADGSVIDMGTTSSRAAITHVAASDSLQLDADPDNATASSQFTFKVDGTTELQLDGSNLYPGANDGNALGKSGTAWADLWLASGGLIEFDGGTTNTFTCTAGHCTIEGATVWDSGNDGSGSTLDADLLDGKNTGTSGNVVPLLDGTNTWSGAQTITLGTAATTEPLDLFNTTDNASVQVMELEGDRATMADNDEAYMSFILSNDGGTQTEIARQSWIATDVNAGTSVDGDLQWSVMTAGTLADELELSGAELFPVTNDGLALGKSGTAFADLWGASGFTIEWDGGTTNTMTCTSGSCTIEGNTMYRAGGTDVALADGGTGASLTDPNLDALPFWDDSAGTMKFTALADLNTEATPAAGDYLFLIDAAGNLLKVNWSNVASGGGATTALDNLAAVAINTSLISDTDSTDNLGSSSIAWASLFVDNVEFGAATTDTLNCASGNCTIEGNALKRVGTQTIWIPASAMYADITSPASCGDTYDSGSNDVTLKVCAFDAGATEERADFTVAFPKNWNEGTVTAAFFWTNTAGLTTETVQWEIGCVAISDDDTLNATLGTTVTQSDTWLAQNDLHVTATSSAITCGGTPAAGDQVFFRVSRDTSVDNMTGDALLTGIKLFFTDDAANDN